MVRYARLHARLLRNVQRTTGLFTSSYLIKLFAAGFLALSCRDTRSVRSERITRRQILLAAAAGLLLFFFGNPLRHRSMSQRQA